MKKYMIVLVDAEGSQVALFRDTMDEITDAYLIGKRELGWIEIQIYAKLEGDEQYTFVGIRKERGIQHVRR